ncbi:hypothetical protein TUM20985_40630 [Mycobacterium antarcticum]|uniref:hypothetical protein n=1 Tax=unclassified Mycolicibacterium TaxID=2636767 RepID=UPI00238E218D|nr:MULTISPECIES: hypothetical protein [unclassified Mycolicibacterium]BDX33516.1 hypothetical protein TUM20985_40630 [Mycolicibacterium sp. TUM20985]GLP82873.1 hypothetical protein TUM20984_42930 [Mycolicibacterium sp. TUM20984]
MSKTAALDAELEILTAALDDPDADVANSLRWLTLSAAAAVTSYLGLSVLVAGSDPPLAFTVLADGVTAGDAQASLHVDVPGVGGRTGRLAVTVTLYAGVPGAFVDLAADLAWLTKSPPSDFTMDQHLAIPTGAVSGNPLRAATLVNQAIGVLIGRGYSPEQALGHLDAEAARARTDRRVVAQRILARLSARDEDGTESGLRIR